MLAAPPQPALAGVVCGHPEAIYHSGTAVNHRGSILLNEASFSDDRVQRFLSGKDTAVLATINPDGGPLATPMWFVHDLQGMGMVSVHTLQKIMNLRRDPRVSVVAESAPGAGVACLIIQGTVAFVAADEDRRSLGEQFIDKYGEALERRWGARGVPDSRTLFRIYPSRVNVYGAWWSE